MKDWQNEILSTWEITIKEFEQLSKNIGELVETISEELVETVDFLTEQIDTYLPLEIEQFLNELFQPIVELEQVWRWENWENTEFEEYFSDFTEFTVNPKIEPSPELYPACMGCHQYHGRVYNGNILVCGMHPYGWEDENCPDVVT
ncbi:hypothetical protein [Gloeocapsa sp. PCC 73106]|uniref:hypothetical protein n=1 Tax=Gloeocapsa sp. PCC 73106 TaxID=102232 RepID=UPI0002AC8FCD|nr:hypothetical protein [Gloeocapsa sp. PCC 73106]ELR99991.1 hypothetical protein GLO73106DRAFT_00038450 [Gloeocapsa sp. PCC 73106]